MKEKQRYIYFAETEDSRLIKIGSSFYPMDRIKVLSDLGDGPVRMLFVIEARDSSEEAEIHKAMLDHRAHGEWYCPTADFLLQLKPFMQRQISLGRFAREGVLQRLSVDKRKNVDPSELTPNESRVLELYRAGRTVREIADILCYKRPSSVGNIVSHAAQKERCLLYQEIGKRNLSAYPTTLKQARGQVHASKNGKPKRERGA